MLVYMVEQFIIDTVIWGVLNVTGEGRNVHVSAGVNGDFSASSCLLGVKVSWLF